MTFFSWLDQVCCDSKRKEWRSKWQRLQPPRSSIPRTTSWSCRRSRSWASSSSSVPWLTSSCFWPLIEGQHLGQFRIGKKLKVCLFWLAFNFKSKAFLRLLNWRLLWHFKSGICLVTISNLMAFFSHFQIRCLGYSLKVKAVMSGLSFYFKQMALVMLAMF